VRELVDAVQEGNLPLLRRLLAAEPARAAARDDRGLPLVLVAAYFGQQHVIDTLLAAGADVDPMTAAALGRVTELAIALDIDPTLVTQHSPDGFTALHYAAFFEQPDAARLLVARGADVRAIANGLAPIHSAAARGALTPRDDDGTARHDVVEVLLDAGADPDATQVGGHRAVHAAAANGDRAVIALLRVRGADLTARTDDGSTAADIARTGGHAELADELERGDV
jgi:ankyrin repeat protein